jgi:hypothetical protein
VDAINIGATHFETLSGSFAAIYIKIKMIKSKLRRSTSSTIGGLKKRIIAKLFCNKFNLR